MHMNKMATEHADVRGLPIGTRFKVKDRRSPDADIIFIRIKRGVIEERDVLFDQRKPLRTFDCWEPIEIVK